MMIHAFYWKHHLPSNKPDQISKVITQSIAIRKVKASLYYIEWKMTKQYFSFGGLDACNHVEFGNFEKRYILRFYK